jgi:hypothetical protein
MQRPLRVIRDASPAAITPATVMGNCFRSGDDADAEEIASRLAETTEAADAKYIALSAQLAKSEQQRERVLNEVCELKAKDPAGVTAVMAAIKARQNIPIRYQRIHTSLQQLNSNLEKFNRDIASITNYMKTIQMQRDTAASISVQSEQTSMMSKWKELTTSLGITTHSVIEDQSNLEADVEDMKSIGDAVQFGLHASLTSTAGGGGILGIAELLDEADEHAMNSTPVTSSAATTRLRDWDTEFSDDTVIELTATATAVPKSTPTRQRYTFSTEATHGLLGQ